MPHPTEEWWTVFLEKVELRSTFPLSLHFLGMNHEFGVLELQGVVKSVEHGNDIVVSLMRRVYPFEDISSSRYAEYACQMVRDIVLSFFAHEADECIHIDGRKVFDPHSNEYHRLAHE